MSKGIIGANWLSWTLYNTWIYINQNVHIRSVSITPYNWYCMMTILRTQSTELFSTSPLDGQETGCPLDGGICQVIMRKARHGTILGSVHRRI